MKLTILDIKQINNAIFEVNEGLRDTAGKPELYNGEEFVTFSKVILGELLDDQKKQTVRDIVKWLRENNMARVPKDNLIIALDGSADWQALQQQGEE